MSPSIEDGRLRSGFSTQPQRVFPCLQRRGTIASLVITALQSASKLTPNYEVIVVNDGSSDSTAQILDELTRVYPQLKIVTHRVNRGYGGALRSGFSTASKDVIFYTDGDAQYDPSEIELLWPKMAPGVDLVNGYKISRSDPWHRIVIGRIYHHTVKMMFGLRVRDVDCDFRLLRRSIFERVRLEKNSGVICLEMMKKIQDAGFTDRRSAGSPLPSRARPVAVLQLPPRDPHGHRRAEAVVRARRAANTSAIARPAVDGASRRSAGQRVL